MFDVGFWELVILFGLGLIILGPERLPKVAMQVGNWAGQARRMARHLSSQFRDELNEYDLKDPFSSADTNRQTPNYNRPGVDELKPSMPSDDAPVDEESQGSTPESADKTADKAD